ncbi:RHS domain-containing protein [Burkholderia arboris]|uniref:RHS repeat-associated core domain-containing protein n=1 Tax=Burkholderia arboris TaxID=488730 RepID=UPI001CA38920|nr:RHS repeat-associated core domain-containing protein [Burkholderia arboris]MBY8607591.1 RHS domain-containing protein [Burkholderia arboris]
MTGSSTAVAPRPPQLAVAPLNTIHPEDIAAASRKFDQWLQQISGGVVTLERLSNVAQGLPVIGNVIALVSVALDVKELHDKPSADAMDWVNIGIDLIGVIPVPPTLAAARMSLRPMLAEARRELAVQLKAAAKDAVKVEANDVLVGLLASHLNATIVGDLEKFVQEAQVRLDAMLKDAGELLEKMLLDMAQGMKKAALGQLNAEGNAELAAKEASQAAEIFVRDPEASLKKGLWSLYHATKASVETVSNEVVNVTTTRQQREQMAADVDRKIRELAGRCKGALATLADPRVGAIAKLLTLLLAVVQASRKKHARKGQGANVPENRSGQASKNHGQGAVDGISVQAGAKQDGGCKECRGTKGSISFARGAERIDHDDFTLPGPFPFTWSRQYRSDLAAYDDGPLGARWITPYMTRFDIVHNDALPESLHYHAADGRTHAYPLPKVGAFHYDAIENVTLVRVSDRVVTLARGYDAKETYERHGEHFRLTGIVLRNGEGLAIAYDYPQTVPGHTLLPSDLMAYHGDEIEIDAHVRVVPDAQGRVAQLWLIENGKPVRQLARYTFDDAGDLIEAFDENGASRSYTYQHHLITRYTDRTGRGMNLRWDGEHATARAVREWADDGSYDTTLEWDRNIRLTYVTDALGHETWYYYDILGYTYRIRHADGRSEWIFRDDAKNIVRHIHPDGSIETFTYDDRSNPVSHTRADGYTVYFAYDARDNVRKIRDGEGGVWLRDYNTKDQLIEEIDPLGNKTEYTNNALGQPVEIVDAKGGKKQLAYSPTGQLTSYTDCSGKTSRWQYSGRGQLERFTDAAGSVTQYRYAEGQLAEVVRPDGVVEQFERDAEGRLLAHVDGLLRRTEWRYTRAGLIATRTGANGESLGYRWDKLGRLEALKNENGRETSFEYDPVGRLLTETGFDGKTSWYRYDPASGVLQSVQNGDQGHRITTVEFDAVGRLTSRQTGQWGADARQWKYGEQERFAYNGNGQMVLAENDASRLQWFHDEAGNVTREHQHFQFLKGRRVAVWRHEYDVLNERVATIRPDGHRVAVLTYGSGHVHGIMLDDTELVQIERDALHREIERVQGNGLTQTQEYDAAGRLLRQKLTATRSETPGGKRLVQRSYTYDRAGQLERIEDTQNGMRTYRYDPVGRLVAATGMLGEETFAFDPASNLLDDAQTRHFEPDPVRGTPGYSSRIQGRPALLDNLLREYAGTHYTWNEYGNLIERRKDGDQAWFEWDGFDRLVQFDTGKVSVRYWYDALGRRVAKESNARVRVSSFDGSDYRAIETARLNAEYGYGLTLYGWDGDTLAWESGNGEHGGSGRTTHYVYEPNSFVPMVQATHAGWIPLHERPEYDEHYDIDRDPLWSRTNQPVPFAQIGYYQCDQIGTPQEVTDAQGEIAWSARYRAWGEAKEVISEAARKAGIRNPIRFQGQYFDHETGLHYNRHRYYDPGSGRFVSKDPIGLTGGINAYQYAANPIEWVDPLGLARTSSGGAGRKPTSNKPNQNSKCPCRKEWEVTRYDRICEAMLNGTRVKYFRDPKTKQWWSADTEGHGGSAWKVMEEQGGNLVHFRDADIYGDFMGKHKGETGKTMSMKDMKCRDARSE